MQTFSGAAMNITGPTTVHVGTLNYAPSVPTTIGGTNRAITITRRSLCRSVLATSTPPNQQPPPIDQVTQATLTTNANTTLLVNNLTLNPGQNSLSNFVQNGGTVQVNGTVQMSNSAGGSTITLNGGTFIAAGGRQCQRCIWHRFRWALTRDKQAGAPPLTRPYEFTVLNVNGGAPCRFSTSSRWGCSLMRPAR